MKYLKTGLGFANYEIESGRNRRFEKKERAFHSSREVVTISELRASMPRLRASVMRHLPFDKWALIGNRALAMAAGAVTDEDLAAFLARYDLGVAVAAEAGASAA
jgi:hypothetical protein